MVIIPPSVFKTEETRGGIVMRPSLLGKTPSGVKRDGIAFESSGRSDLQWEYGSGCPLEHDNTDEFHRGIHLLDS